MKTILSITLSILLLTFLNSTFLFSQTGQTNYFGGSATITNNGISLLPSFSLRKPAAIFDMKAGRKLTFEPQFRFARLLSN